MEQYSDVRYKQATTMNSRAGTYRYDVFPIEAGIICYLSFEKVLIMPLEYKNTVVERTFECTCSRAHTAF